MGRLGPTEILIVLALVVLLFGGSRISRLGRELGESIRGFRRGASGADEEKPAALDCPQPHIVEIGERRNG